MDNLTINTSAIKEIYVVYYDSDIMFAGSQGDCLSFLEGARELYTYIQNWKCTTVEEYGSNMYEMGYDSGYDSGYDHGCDAE